MSTDNEHLDSLREIRSIMERSTQFLSLSGLSGVFAGVFALLGVMAVYLYSQDFFFASYYNHNTGTTELIQRSVSFSGLPYLIIGIGFSVLFLALFIVVMFTVRNAKRKGLPYWNSTAKRMLINLLIPLVAGGLFCLVLIFHGLIYLLAPVTLIFYGLALVNASKYTLRDVRYLGLIEIGLGLLSSIFIGYSIMIWALGFGILHIVYGLTMYYKYERFNS
ncbi:hypothetical protein [Perlabentimonas gracilis]|uniref:hypothetical protein n=1 Tax=Perlabentimonas gracilis TaxID=2715279 RepID=UPI00140C8C84|nr:hypothetical protein [Perlabentimonas gracilis]NHB70007.1 hypothetical protein [Perlabentimonas gracilis]